MAKRISKPKFKVGDMVYSWQNPDVRRRVSHVFPSEHYGYPHKYKVALVDSEGYSRSSKYMDETSLCKRRTPEWFKEHGALLKYRNKPR